MPDVWSRKKWNEEIIQEINDLIEENLVCRDILQVEPLEEVDPKHVWHKEEDVQLVRDKLIEICPLNEEFEFSEDIPDIWKQRTIDEFKEAIERGCQGITETYSVVFTPGLPPFIPDQYIGGPQIYFSQLYPWGFDIQVVYSGWNIEVNSWSVKINGSVLAFGEVVDGVLVGAEGEYDGRAEAFEIAYEFSCRYVDEY